MTAPTRPRCCRETMVERQAVSTQDGTRLARFVCGVCGRSDTVSLVPPPRTVRPALERLVLALEAEGC